MNPNVRKFNVTDEFWPKSSVIESNNFRIEHFYATPISRTGNAENFAVSLIIRYGIIVTDNETNKVIFDARLVRHDLIETKGVLPKIDFLKELAIDGFGECVRFYQENVSTPRSKMFSTRIPTLDELDDCMAKGLQEWEELGRDESVQ